VTLLKELGIDATIVIVRTGLRGDFDSSIASLAPFDHAIAYVPSLDLYLDGTAEYTGSTELPAMDVGSVALLVNQGDARLVRLPTGKAEDNLRRKVITADLRADGSARVSIELEARGGHAPGLRRRYQATAKLSERATEDLSREMPGFQLQGGAHAVKAQVDDLEAPVLLNVEGTATRFARVEGEQLNVDVTPSFRLGPTYASLSHRALPVNLPPIGVLDTTFVVRTPPSLAVVSAPEAKSGKTEFGEYSLEVSRSDRETTIQTRIAMRTLKVAPAKYAAFRAFAADLDHALTQRLIVGPR
jgi:hypothetical protein